MRRNRFSTIQILVVVLAVAFVSAVYTAYATPPASKYLPGETLDPTCGPGDVECSVIPMNIGDEVGSGDDLSVLFVDTNGLLAEDNTNFLYDDTTDILSVDEINLPTTSSSEGIIYVNSSRFIHAYGTDNIFIGRSAGNFTLTTGSALRNTALGSLAVDALTTGDDNVGIGYQALTSNTDGVDNTAIGVNSLVNNSTGDANVAIGRLALQRNISGDFNTAVGTSAFQAQGSGTYNTGIGYQALYGGLNDAIATHNTALGALAGASVTTGSRNTFIGAYSDLISSTPTLSDSIALGYLTQIRASNQFVVGSETSPINDAYFGEGVISTGPSDIVFNATGGSGTDIAGADFTIASGKATGVGVGGDVIFSTPDVGVSGTTLQSLTEKMRLTFGGRLGIGTTTPDFEFEAVSATQNIEIIATGYNGRKPVFAGRSANGTEALPTASIATDILAEFAGQGYGATGFASSSTAGIRVVAEETFDDAGYGSQLLFRTTPNNSTTLTSRMIILADGNVGIGDTTPDDLLNIQSITNTGIAISAIGADVDPYIKFELVDGTPSFTMGIDDSDSDSFKISTTALGTSDRFIIDSSGNVNVGGDGTPNSLFSVGATSQFQVSSSGSIDAVTTVTTSGGIIIGSSGTGALSVGTTSGIYRTTSAGGNVTPQTVFDVDNSNSIAGSQAYLFDTTSGFVFTAANGTRRIARAAIDIVSLTNTAGSETGDLAFFTKPSGAAITERLRIETGGKVGIGDISPDYLLDVENTGADTDIFALTDSDGACLYNPEAGSVTVTCSSDERLKENIENAGEFLPYFRGFDIREYDVRASGDHMVGVVAQEVMETYPELVKMGGNGFYTVEIPSTWEMIKAIQELDIAVQDISSLDLENENSLANKLIAWFADTANGIQNIFAKRVTVEELCVEDVCIDKNDLLQILNNNGGNAGGGDADAPVGDGGDVTPPDEGDGDVSPPEEPVVSPDDEVLPPTDSEDDPPLPQDDGEDAGGEGDAPPDSGDIPVS